MAKIGIPDPSLVTVQPYGQTLLEAIDPQGDMIADNMEKEITRESK